MKRTISTLLGLATMTMATAQNYVATPLGLYGSLYDAGTTIGSGGGILVGSGGTWALGGDIASADKTTGNSPSAAARPEVITFDGTGTYSGAATTAGAIGNVVSGYAASTSAWTGSVLPLGNATSAYPLTIPTGNAITASYFDGLGGTQLTPVTGFSSVATTEFSHYYDIPSGIVAGAYTFSYPAGLTAGQNSLLSSGNTASGGTNGSTTYSLLANIANIGITAGTVAATLPASTATQVFMATSPSVLPITLVSFTGVKTPAGNLLNWKASNAVNFKNFVVQRSADGSSFAAIATVAANNTGSYNFTDAAAIGTTYYRLALVDVDGTTTFSNIVQITTAANSFMVKTVYPVPAKNELNISLYTPTTAKVTYTIADMGGRILATESHTATGSTYQQLNVAGLASGTYILTIATGSTKLNTKFNKL